MIRVDRWERRGAGVAERVEEAGRRRKDRGLEEYGFVGRDVRSSEDTQLSDCGRLWILFLVRGLCVQFWKLHGADLAFGSRLPDLCVEKGHAVFGEAIGLMLVPRIDLSSGRTVFWEVCSRIKVRGVPLWVFLELALAVLV